MGGALVTETPKEATRPRAGPGSADQTCCFERDRKQRAVPFPRPGQPSRGPLLTRCRWLKQPAPCHCGPDGTSSTLALFCVDEEALEDTPLVSSCRWTRVQGLLRCGRVVCLAVRCALGPREHGGH